MRTIVFAVFVAIAGMLGACYTESSGPPAAGEALPTVMTSTITQGVTACVCTMDNCEWASCGCDDACSDGDACVRCCEGICKVCKGQTDEFGEILDDCSPEL